MRNIELQEKLIIKEGKEVFKAYESGVLIDFVKELCDLFVVTSYMCYLKANMRGTQLDTKKTFSLTLQERDRLPTHMLHELEIAVANQWHASIINNVLGLLTSLKVNSRAIMNYVIDNNFDKFEEIFKGTLPSALHLDETCGKIEEKSTGRYAGVYWEIVEDSFIVYRSSTGKILKPLNFKPLNLKGLIEEPY